MQTIVGGVTTVDPRVLLPGFLVMLLVITGLTLLFTFVMTLESDKKKQVPAAALLFIAMLLCFTLPISFPGNVPAPVYLLFPLAILALVPLSVIIPGVLWFWPADRKKIMIISLLCSGITFGVEVLLYVAVTSLLSPSRAVSALTGFLNMLINLPMGISLAYLAVFLISTGIAFLVYCLLGSAHLPGGLRNKLQEKEHDGQQ
jgi:hypothetical protein